MKDTKNMLEQESLKQAPFTVPEGYFATVEDRVRERIAQPAKRSRLWTVLKPGIAVAAMFLIIIGLGYATLSLTGTLGSGRSARMLADADTEISVVEADLNEKIEELPDDELMEYLSETVSLADLQLFLADNYSY